MKPVKSWKSQSITIQLKLCCLCKYALLMHVLCVSNTSIIILDPDPHLLPAGPQFARAAVTVAPHSSNCRNRMNNMYIKYFMAAKNVGLR